MLKKRPRVETKSEPQPEAESPVKSRRSGRLSKKARTSYDNAAAFASLEDAVVSTQKDVNSDDDIEPSGHDFDEPLDYEFDLPDDLDVILDDGDDISDVELVTEAPAQASEPTIEEDGLIRIGRQPLFAAKLDVRSAPERMADRWVQEVCMTAWRKKDSRLPKAEIETIEEAKGALKDSFQVADNGRFKRFCDYTGSELSWSNGPRSMSLEAIYPVANTRGHLGYHTSKNVGMVATTINLAKGQWPSVTLPLVAVWLNTHEVADFEEQKGLWSWCMNALMNTAMMSRLFRINNSHKYKMELWSSWDFSTQQDGLEVLRTGKRRPVLDEKLASSTSLIEPCRDLIRNDGKFSPLRSEKRGEWTSLYEILETIAALYGLSKSEFKYYSTIPSPGRPRYPVFFPYHILARPQAIALGWDWNTWEVVAREMLATMRRSCNKHAEASGLGEPWITKKLLICWMAAVTCQRIKEVKEEQPGSTQYEIAFHLFDRWGLPMVPWMNHPFRISLCKKQDHGIAMLFGIDKVELETFDPRLHLDLSRSTITIDTWFTNRTMFHYEPGLWGDIRSVISQVPLNHPYWRVDASLGNDVWKGE